jgi:MFS family permease
LWTAGIVTVIGANLTIFAVPVQVYVLTRNSAYVGLAGLFALVPLVVFGLLGGAWADAMDRRILLIISSCGLALGSVLLWLQAVLPLHEAIDVADRIGRALPPELLCTSEGGCCLAPAAQACKAEYQRSIQQAAQIRALAAAEAERVARVGIAQALATEEQVRAYGGPQFQVTQTVLNRFAEVVITEAMPNSLRGRLLVQVPGRDNA